MWYRDYQQGHGVMYYYNGDKYDGYWQQDKRQGKGKYTFAGGAYYEVTGKTTRSRVRDSLLGATAQHTMVCGSTTNVQEKA